MKEMKVPQWMMMISKQGSGSDGNTSSSGVQQDNSNTMMQLLTPFLCRTGGLDEGNNYY